MANGKDPSRLYFNNVVSMGVSYSWERPEGAAACTGMTKGSQSLIKRTKDVSLDLLNVDLSNAGGSTLASMANNQEKYVVTDLVDIYANGVHAGKGKLSSFSINEGSMSNDSVTNLSYTIPSTDGEAEDDDPVERSESIQVSRDVEAKSYTIEHSYSISFGDDFDMISNYPLYKDNPAYKSVDGRLALGEKEANEAIYDNPLDYGEYLDLSAYATEEGWKMKKLKDSCSGIFSSSSVTKDYINGNYSITETTNIRYTGQDIEDKMPSYEVEYRMSWGEETRGKSKKPCAIVKMDGTIIGVGGGRDCSSGYNPKVLAESGYQEFVVGGPAEDKASAFFDYIQSNIEGLPKDPLNEMIFGLKKSQCVPSVNKDGQKNDGKISFSFEMNNCPEIQPDGSVFSRTLASNTNYQKCNQNDILVTSTSVSNNLSAAPCLLQLDENGNYPRFESISGDITSIMAQSKALAESSYSAEFESRNVIKSDSYTYNPYEANLSYQVNYSDALSSDACQARGSDPCSNFKTKVKKVPKRPRYIDTETVKGILSEQKGYEPATRTVNTSIKWPKTGCGGQSVTNVIEKIKTELENNEPDCIITSLNWSFSHDLSQNAIQASASMAGVDDY